MYVPTTLDGKKTMMAESIDSDEFFLDGLRQRLSILETKRNKLRSTLAGLESEERTLRLKNSKIQGLLISQEIRHRQDLESITSQHRVSEEHLWASKLEREEKCRKLESEIEAIRRRKQLVNRPSLT